ncbi:MAG: hypothetical protein WCW13_01250 [archaeon]|jgi:ribosomal protein L34E
MVSPQKQRQKYRHRKSSTKTKREYFDGKHKLQVCSLTGKKLHGVPHETKCGMLKHSKTEKRPSVPFGGVLSGEARAKVFIEMGKVLAGVKKLDEVDEKYRKYVKQAIKRADIE